MPQVVAPHEQRAGGVVAELRLLRRAVRVVRVVYVVTDYVGEVAAPRHEGRAIVGAVVLRGRGGRVLEHVAAAPVVVVLLLGD